MALPHRHLRTLAHQIDMVAIWVITFDFKCIACYDGRVLWRLAPGTISTYAITFAFVQQEPRY
jgi:hypothetical protein